MRRASLFTLVAFGFLTFAAVAFGAGHRVEETTGNSFFDFLVEIAPAVNLVVLAFFGNAMRRNSQMTEAVQKDVRSIHRSGVRVVTDTRGVPRAIQTASADEAYDAEGEKWVRARPGGRRAYDREADNDDS